MNKMFEKLDEFIYIHMYILGICSTEYYMFIL